MVVPTGAVVCGRADGPHRPIERLRLESLNRRIKDDPPYQACSVQSAPTLIGAGLGADAGRGGVEIGGLEKKGKIC